MSCECHRLYFILQSCRDILSLVFQIFHTIPTVPDAALTDRIQACVKVLYLLGSISYRTTSFTINQ